MNKTVSRFKRTIRVFGIKVCDSDEQYECVYLENTEPITPFIVTEYEMKNFKNEDED